MMLRGKMLRAASKQSPELIGYINGVDLSGSYSLNISSLGVHAGDIGIFVADQLYYGSVIETPSGFTRLENAYSSGTQNDLHLFARVMNGTETEVSGSGSSGDIAMQFMLWRNAAYNGVTEKSNVASNLPPMATAPDDVAIVSVGMTTDSSDPPPTYTVPSGYVGLDLAGNTSVGSYVATAYNKSPAIPSEDPPGWSPSGEDGRAAVGLVLSRAG